jgi:hypothetical protein
MYLYDIQSAHQTEGSRHAVMITTRLHRPYFHFKLATTLMWLCTTAHWRRAWEEEPLIEPADPHQHEPKADEG